MNSRPLSRRHFLQTSTTLAALPWVGSNLALAADAIPQSVQELWADFDPRKDALETEIIREWKEDGGVFRHVRFLVGNFKGKPARLTAIYGFPDGAKERLPAVMHIHGGGQRAFLGEVKFLVGRGYAALSVNWGGSGTGKPPFNSPEGAQPGDQTRTGARSIPHNSMCRATTPCCPDRGSSSRTASIRRTTTGICSRSAAAAM